MNQPSKPSKPNEEVKPPVTPPVAPPVDTPAPAAEVASPSRKRTINATVAGGQKANFYPDINAGICEFCGHPPYKCPSCGQKQKQSPLDKHGVAKWPTHCQNRKCMKELPPEATDPLAFCDHYRDLREDLLCIFCRDRRALFYRKNKVRGIVKPDGSEELVIVCSNLPCLIDFQKRFAPERKLG